MLITHIGKRILSFLLGVVLLTTIGVGGASEARLAGCAVMVGMLCTGWFGLWTASVDALYGVHLSLASSIGLMVGGLVWLVEALICPSALVPRAVVRRC